MKAVILAGGLGTRLSQETETKPKPMVEVGEYPILWHILKTYSHYGINDFVICCGYKGYLIKEYFLNYYKRTFDLTVNFRNNIVEIHNSYFEPWNITFAETGASTMTGGRIQKIKKYVEDEEMFCLTYGDGLINSNICDTIEFHKSHGKMVTMTTAFPPGRFGVVKINEDQVTSFQEKPDNTGDMVNAGYFVVSPKAIDLIENDQTTWENEPLNALTKMGELKAYKHTGFWQPMDTLPDKNLLNKLWETSAPWKVW